MRYRHLLISAFLLSNSAHAGMDLVIDGREIRLEDDGTWRYLSTDRYIDTPDGKRVRLKEDGQWQYVGNTPLVVDQRQRTQTLDLKLRDVVIERTEKKVQKNTRVRTRTVFSIDITIASEAEGTMDLSRLVTGDVSVSDDSGASYEVTAIRADRPDIAPGKTATITVIVDKSPSIFDEVRSMSVMFGKQVFGTPSPVTLSRQVDDIEELRVENFK